MDLISCSSCSSFHRCLTALNVSRPNSNRSLERRWPMQISKLHLSWQFFCLQVSFLHLYLNRFRHRLYVHSGFTVALPESQSLSLHCIGVVVPANGLVTIPALPFFNSS